jgi:hypothetical protein
VIITLEEEMKKRGELCERWTGSGSIQRKRDTDKICKENQTNTKKRSPTFQERILSSVSFLYEESNPASFEQNLKEKKKLNTDLDLSEWYQQVLYCRLSFSFSGPIY